MKRTTLTITRPRSLELRLTDVRDAAHATVNGHHFDLRPGAAENLTSALREGVNVLDLVVTTTRFREKVLNLALDRPQWQGRFELYLNGQLAGVYADQGAALLGGGHYPIARLELTIFTPLSAPAAHELIDRLRAVPGMTDTAPTDVGRAHAYAVFKSEITLRIWKNRFGVDFVYVVDASGACAYAGYVGWAHAGALRHELAAIREEYREALV